MTTDLLTPLACSLVAGTTSTAIRGARTYRGARQEQREAARREAARRARERAAGWTAMTARAAAAFMVGRFGKKRMAEQIFIDEAGEEVPHGN